MLLLTELGIGCTGILSTSWWSLHTEQHPQGSAFSSPKRERNFSFQSCAGFVPVAWQKWEVQMLSWVYPFLPLCRVNPIILCSFQPLWLQTDCDAQKFREEKGNGLEIKIEQFWLNNEKIVPEILKFYRSGRIYAARVKSHLELQQFFCQAQFTLLELFSSLKMEECAVL